MSNSQPPTERPSVVVHTRLPAAVHDALTAIAARDERSVSWLLRKAAEQVVAGDGDARHA